MPTIFVEGDLFADADLSAVAHGCNCAGAMGKGIALTFRERFPEMYKEYKARCADGRFTLGDVFVWSKETPVIFNLGTQKTPRPTAEMGAVEKSLRTMIKEATAMSASACRGSARVWAVSSGRRFGSC